MNPSKKPLLLVIGNPDEDWYSLCKPYLSKIEIEQACWKEISLTSYSDSPSLITLHPSISSPLSQQHKIRQNIKPSLILIRMFSRYIGSNLGEKPDYRNILYGLYHSNIPLINDFNALIAELEKPIMYGRLRKIRDEVGEKNFPLIKQYYYPEYNNIVITPSEPCVLKVGFPHAGYGKIRIFNRDELDDISSIIAINNNYSSIEPLIDVDYELRIVFIAPNYYRAHKRIGINWKVNFGMANEREDVEMKSNWKKWIDLIYKKYPDMLTFDIDALVDKKGNEYILEVNGSCQGFAPEHGDQDLIHLRNLCLRKLESISGIEILEEKDDDMNNLFKEKIIENVINEDEKETKIVNLKNLCSNLEKELNGVKRELYQMKEVNNLLKKERNQKKYSIIIYIMIGFIIHFIIIIIYKIFFEKNKYIN